MFYKDIFTLLSMLLFVDTVLPNLHLWKLSDYKMLIMSQCSQDRLFKAILQFLNSWLNLFVSKRTYYILWRLASEESQAANFYSFNKIQIIFSENFSISKQLFAGECERNTRGFFPELSTFPWLLLSHYRRHDLLKISYLKMTLNFLVNSTFVRP